MVEEPWLFVSGLLHESDCPTVVATENRIRAGADAAMGYPRFGMIDLLKRITA